MRESCQRFIDRHPFMAWPLRSRTHLLWKNSYGEVWVKREDELSFISSGPKRRKHASFFAMALEMKVPGLKIAGSLFSNNSVAMAASARELGIPFEMLSPKAKSPLKGNALLNAMMSQTAAVPSDTFVTVPEGANHPWSLAGALTLGLDLEDDYDQIVCDAGTGYTAAALSFTLERSSLITLKVAPADLHLLTKDISKQLNLPMPPPSREIPVSSGLSPIGKREWLFFKDIWQNHGLLLDPIYTARSFLWTKQNFDQGQLPGKTLLLHTGGGLSLLGFEEEFKKLIS